VEQYNIGSKENYRQALDKIRVNIKRKQKTNKLSNKQRSDDNNDDDDNNNNNSYSIL
jgi:hypothetical protein